MGEKHFDLTDKILEISSLRLKMSAVKLVKTTQAMLPVASRGFSRTGSALERFGSSDGSSGWKWEKGGIGMGGKDKGVATQAKPEVGKDKAYKAPEFFKYDKYSYFDAETAMVPKRVEQPKSGATEFW